MGIYGPPGLNGWISDMYDLNPTRLDTLDGHNGHGHCGLAQTSLLPPTTSIFSTVPSKSQGQK